MFKGALFHAMFHFKKYEYENIWFSCVMEIYFQLCCIPRKVAFPFQADSIPIRGGGGYLPWEWKLFLHELPISTTFYYISFFTSTFFNFLIKSNLFCLNY